MKLSEVVVYVVSKGSIALATFYGYRDTKSVPLAVLIGGVVGLGAAIAANSVANYVSPPSPLPVGEST